MSNSINLFKKGYVLIDELDMDKITKNYIKKNHIRELSQLLRLTKEEII